jgi:hypothetical protein
MSSGWQLNGSVLIACNCDWGCPCNFNARPSRGHCEGGWIWMIESGHVNGVRLDGLGVALFADWPGAIHEGGGRAACYLDERGDTAQRATLTNLLQGKVGGPWGLFRKTYDLAAPKPASFDVTLAKHATRATVGEFVELELEAIRNPVTKDVTHPQVVLPEGLVVKHGNVAASKVFRVSGGVEYDHSGQYAAFGVFAYS